MTFNVSEFRAQLTGDGARPNLFNVTLTLPNIVNNATNAGKKLQFMAKAAQLPGSTVNNVPLHYFGREVKFAGNRTFADWTLTIINDEDFVIRSAMENWLNNINSHAGNLRSANAVGPTNYTCDATVTQYGKAGDNIQAYDFVGMFPVDVSTIDLNWDTTDSIEEYTVTFAYQYWTNKTSTDA